MESNDEIARVDVGQRARAMTTPTHVAAAQIMAVFGTLGLDVGWSESEALETASRIARFWASYERLEPTVDEVAGIMSPFFEGPEYKEMVIVSRIRFDALCEHHFLPFTGYAAIGYIPKGRVFGLSKTARVLEYYCKRPTMQERLTSQLADMLDDILDPKGLGVVLYDTMHSCMSLRGVKSHEATTTTSALRGVFMNEPETRAEFLSLARHA